MDKEEWRDIPGYEGLYQVSNLGNVRSMSRVQRNKKLGTTYFRQQRGRQRILRKNKRLGYIYVDLWNISGRTHRVHRLVAKAFLTPDKSRPDVNHKNGDKTDNRLENLEWCTKSENAQHAIETGLRKNQYGQESNLAKLKEHEVLNIISDYESGMGTQKQIGLKYGISQSHVSLILKGKSWQHINPIWLRLNNRKLGA